MSNPRANYGADEHPRQCKCGHTVSRVIDNYNVITTIHRKRRCTKCGKTFKTKEKISAPITT